MMYLRLNETELIPIENFYSQTGFFTPAPKGLYTDIHFAPTETFVNNIYPKLQKMAYDFESFHSIQILSQIEQNDRKFIDPKTIRIDPVIGEYVVLLREDKVKVFTLSISSQGPMNMDGQKIFYKMTFVSPIVEDI